MNKIDDLMLLAGAHRLDTFDWGPRLVEVVNFVANDGTKIHVEMTGKEAHAAMRGLPSPKLLKMLAVSLDIETGVATGVEESLPQPAVEAVPVAPVPAPPLNPNEQWGVNDFEIQPPTATRRSWKIQRKHLLGLAMGFVIVIIAMAMATIVSVTTIKTGTPTDSRGLVAVVQVMGDVVKSLFSSSSPPPQYGPAPYGTDPTDGFGTAPNPQMPTGTPQAPIGGTAPPLGTQDPVVPPDDE